MVQRDDSIELYSIELLPDEERRQTPRASEAEGVTRKYCSEGAPSEAGVVNTGRE